MAPKRKGTSSQPTPKKPKTIPSPEEFKQFYSATVRLVGDLVDESGEIKLADAFRKLVSKKVYPTYYDIISNPISLSEISRNISRNQYSTVDTQGFLADFKLMLDNAATFNDAESPIVDDATKIYEFVKEQCSQFMGEPVQDSLSLVDRGKNLLDDVINHEFEDIGIISGPFMEDVDKSLYPDYFKIVKKPTSFNKVLRELDGKIIKSDDSDEDNLQRFYDAVNLIFTNAQLYNDEASTIHQDAVTLSEYFDGKFNDLKSTIITAKPKTKLKVKPPVKKSTPVPAVKPKAKPVKYVEPEEEEPLEVEEPVPDQEDEEMMDVDEAELKVEEAELASPPPPLLESNVMGKTETLGSTEEVFIKNASIYSAVSTVNQAYNNAQDFNHYRSNHPATRYQLIRDSLFPSQPVDNLSTIFNYQFPANGYCTQAYSISLPSDATSVVSFDFNLHEYLQTLDRPQLTVPSGEDFQCKLFVNEAEVDSIIDAEDIDDPTLKLHYEIKLSYGINIVNFECKVSPNVSKIIKKSQAPKTEPEELGGRHTRHQMQQYKRSWDVEKMTFYVVSSL